MSWNHSVVVLIHMSVVLITSTIGIVSSIGYQTLINILKYLLLRYEKQGRLFE